MFKPFKKTIDRQLINMIPKDVWENILEMDAGQNEYGFDPFGFDPTFLKYIGPPAYFLLRKYFRAEVHGIENIPDDGRIMLVSNHSGQIALDGMVIGSACIFDKDKPRMIRSMVEHWVPTLPYISWILARAGQVTGTRDNARILLNREGCLLVFPEGVRGISKTYDRAYELEEFGKGFMRLALETNTPIIPVAVVGGEEQIPSVWNIESVAKVFNMPSFPLTPFGMIPLPVKYRVYFGEPMTFEGKADDEDKVIGAQVSIVKKAISSLIKRGLDEREGYFF